MKAITTAPLFLSLCGLVACSAAPDAPAAPGGAAENASASTAPASTLEAPVDNDASDRAFHVVAKIPLSPDHTFWIYEPAPGRILLSEELRYPARAMASELAGLRPVEVFKHLAPEAPVPAELVAAEERQASFAASPHPARAQRAVPAQPDTLVGNAGPMSPMDATGPCPDKWFHDNFCNETYPISLCLENWWNGAWGTANEINNGGTAVCPINGSVLFNFSTDDGVSQSWTVNQGFFRQFIWSHYCVGLFCGDSDFDLHASVTNASGKKFQFSFWGVSY